MPNWCDNVVTFEHNDPVMICRVVTGYTGEGLMKEFHPIPDDLVNTMAGSYGADDARQAELEQREQANLAEYGYKNWYDWAVANWGTKWDFTSRDNGEAAVSDDGRSVQLSFNTAWSPPIAFYQRMEELGFKVNAFYFESGMGFCGRYSEGMDDYHEITGNSDWVEENIPWEIDEQFNISGQMGDWESEQEQDQHALPSPEVPEDPGEREVAIHVNDGLNGMGFSGTARQALDVAQVLRPMIDQQAPGETPNWLSDFVFRLEVLCQEAGVLDEDFNEIGG
jgi:hypothetical protein